MNRIASTSIAAILFFMAGFLARAAILYDTVAPGNNYDRAEFLLWYSNNAGPPQAVVVLMPGSNGDGRSMAEDPAWQSFAARHKLALVGYRFTDKPHDQPFIEYYANASQGSGQALMTGKPFDENLRITVGTQISHPTGIDRGSHAEEGDYDNIS